LSQEKIIHLDNDQILWAVVDETELPASLFDHLSGCSQCRARKEYLEQNLVRLGESAERFSPASARKLLLSLEEPRSRRWPWGRRSALVVAMTAVAVVIITFWATNLVNNTPNGRVAGLTQEMWEDERLMAEINLIEENALTPLYVDVSEEYNGLFDEEFMQFVVPIINDEIRSNLLTIRGVALC
jgi:hypothetical protein